MGKSKTSRGVPLDGDYEGVYRYTVKSETRYRFRFTWSENGREHSQQKSGFATADLAKFELERLRKERDYLNRTPEAYGDRTTWDDLYRIKAREYRRTSERAKYLIMFLDRFITWLRDMRGVKPTEPVTYKAAKRILEDYQDYLDECPKRPGYGHKSVSGFLNNSTKMNYLTPVLSMLNTEEGADAIENKKIRLKLWPRNGEREYLLTPEHMTAFFEALDPEADLGRYYKRRLIVRAIAVKAIYTAERQKDLTHTLHKDFHPEKLTFRSSKTGKVMAMPMPKPLWEIYQKVRELNLPGPYAFPNCQTGEPLGSILGVLRTASERANLPQRLTTHLFRHFCADRVARHSGNAKYTQEFVGWHSAAMVDRYTHLDTVGRSWVLGRLDEDMNRILTGQVAEVIPMPGMSMSPYGQSSETLGERIFQDWLDRVTNGEDPKEAAFAIVMAFKPGAKDKPSLAAVRS